MIPTYRLHSLRDRKVLADAVTRHYNLEYAHPSEEQIQAYYNQNSAKYAEATLERIIIPRVPATEDKPQPSEADALAAAEKLRQRWVAGEDPAKVQQAAFEAAGITGAGSPDVQLGPRRPGSLPADQDSVFKLKAGEVSQVYSDAAAYYVYKVESVRQIPLSETKDSIVKTLQQQELQDKMEEICKSATLELNEAYFGAATPAPSAEAHPAPSAPANPGSSPN